MNGSLQLFVLGMLISSTKAYGESCKNWQQPQFIAHVHEAVLHESSGLAPSHIQAGVWYTHNDSGTGPELYRFRLDGQFLGTTPIEGADSTDWEAMSAGPCPDGSTERCLYIGDIGDNDKVRQSIQIYAIPEPITGDPVQVMATWNLEYPEKRFNAEALLVHPQTGEMTIVTKNKSGRSRVFGVPKVPSEGTQRLIPLAEVQIDGIQSSFRKVTGGEWHPDGRHIVLRTYTQALLWQVDPCDPLAHWSKPPQNIMVGLTKQGESIHFQGNDTLLITSEGSPMPLISTHCTNWSPPPSRSCSN